MSFLFIVEYPLDRFSAFCLSIHQLTFGSFPLWAIMDKVTMSAYAQVGVDIFSFSLNRYLELKFLGPNLTLHLTFWETARLLSKAAAPFSVSTSRGWGFQFLHNLVNTCNCLLKIIAFLGGVMSQDFDLHFPNDLPCQVSLHGLICLIFSLEKCVFKFFVLFLRLGLCLYHWVMKVLRIF